MSTQVRLDELVDQIALVFRDGRLALSGVETESGGNAAAVAAKLSTAGLPDNVVAALLNVDQKVDTIDSTVGDITTDDVDEGSNNLYFTTGRVQTMLDTLATVASSGSYNDLTNKPDFSVFDEIIEADTVGDFPSTGVLGKVYVAKDTNYLYRWSGTEYSQMTDQTAIWGQISGTLTDQTDLVNALNLKANAATVNTLSTEFNTVKNTVNTDLSPRLTTAEGEVDTLQTDLGTLTTAHTNTVSRVNTIENTALPDRPKFSEVYTRTQLGADFSDRDWAARLVAALA